MLIFFIVNNFFISKILFTFTLLNSLIMNKFVLKSYADAPKWSKFPSFLKKLCFDLDLKLDMDIDKHLISETVYFKITGDENKIGKCKEYIENSIKEYNNR